MRRFVYRYEGNDREVDPADLPLAIGTGPHAKLPIPPSGDPVIVGHLNRNAEGDLRFEPSGTVDVTYARCKKALPPPRDPGADPDAPPPPVPEPTWDHHELLSPTPLRDGDYLLIGDATRVDVTIDAGVPTLDVKQSRRPVIANVERTSRKQPRKRGGLGFFGKLLIFLFLIALLLAGAVAWLIMTSKRVDISANPPVENLQIQGGWMPEFHLGERRLMRKGQYRATGTLEGHHPLDETFNIGDMLEQNIAFSMRPLPGVVHITTEPPTTSPVNIGSNAVGNTELRDQELEIGSYNISVAPERYLPESTTLAVEGYGKEQTVSFKLTPRWADITVATPQGATVLADGKVVGTAPATFELFEGPHDLILRKELYEPFQTSIVVTANTPLSLPEIRMTPSPAFVKVTSIPEGAKITMETLDRPGEPSYKGETPKEFEVKPFATHRITVVKLGYGTKTEEFRLDPTETKTIVVNMSEQRGIVKMQVEPAAAQLFINGESKGFANRPVYLAAKPQKIEVRLEGYESFSRTVTPTPGFEQVVNVKLRRLGSAPPGSPPGTPGTAPSSTAAADRGPKYRVEGDYDFVKITPGPFKLGSPRSEQGRRSNEAHRDVVLQRPFYLGTTEVTIGQYKAFQSGYSAGSWSGSSLDGDLKPVVSVSWDQAAAYCNWLSDKEGLSKAYDKRGVEFVPVEPMNNGYRLPSEAEWEFCARYSAPGQPPLKFPWGNTLPPKPNSVNIAGTEARAIIPTFLPTHSDGYQTTGDVGTYAANPLGLRDMGGNVSEWCNDGYKIYIGSKSLTDPLGPPHGPLHVWRGSSWRDASISNLRYAYRGYDQKAQPYIGFRVARYVR